MEQVLNVEPRTRTGSATKEVRSEGYVPGVVYGQGEDARHLKFREIDLLRLLRGGGGGQLIELHGLGNASVHVLLKDIQRHPTRRHMLHVDFYEVQMNVAVRTEVPIVFTGESPAVKGGAILIHQLDRVEVECLPRDIPENFTVDLGLLETIDDTIHVSSLVSSEKVTILTQSDDVIASLTLPRVIEEEEEGEEALIEIEGETEIEPEVIHKGRAGDEGEA